MEIRERKFDVILLDVTVRFWILACLRSRA